MLSLIIFNVKVLTQRGVNCLHKAANKIFYIVFFFRKGQHVKKQRFRAFYEVQFCMFYYYLFVHIFLEGCDKY